MSDIRESNGTCSSKISLTSNKPHDVLKYQVTGFKDSDWKSLKEEWESSGPDFDREQHLRKREELKQNFKMEFWFEISASTAKFFDYLKVAKPKNHFKSIFLIHADSKRTETNL